MNSPNPSLQTFIDALERRLLEMSLEEIRESLLQHAHTLQNSDRAAFLAIFEHNHQRHQQQSPNVTWPVDNHPLLEEIDAFVDRIASGEYFDGFGWDHERYLERSFGDESWALEFDEFFSEAHKAFLNGQVGLARAALQRLLYALSLDDDVGTFCGPEPAIYTVGFNLAEAQACYLRAVYETTPAEERAAELAKEWLVLPELDADVILDSLRQSRGPELPELEQFLPDWINVLHSLDRDSPIVCELLLEAAELAGGVDGLRDLARGSETDQGAYYLRWVQALRRAECQGEAIEAAHEALSKLNHDGPMRALIAEELAVLSKDNGVQVVAARRAAWRADPNLLRLIRLYEAASQQSQASETMADELAALDEKTALDDSDNGLRAVLLVLAGRVDDAGAMLIQSTGLTDRSLRDVVVPYLLISGCAGPQHPQWSSTSLKNFLSVVDRSFFWGLFDRHGSTVPSLSELFLAQLNKENVDQDVLSRRLEIAVQAIEHDVDVIVSSTARDQYGRAARLLTYCGEALILANRPEASVVLLQKWKTRYPRHSAFQRELTAAIKETALLTG